MGSFEDTVGIERERIEGRTLTLPSPAKERARGMKDRLESLSYMRG
jgi:hypothetical protein